MSKGNVTSKFVKTFIQQYKLLNYSCFDTKSAPWMKPYDINKNGKFQIDDMNALYGHKFRNPAFACKKSKMTSIIYESQWKLTGLIADQLG